MLTGAQAARVERYISTVDRALIGVSPDERGEVLAGISEHIKAALQGIAEPTDADIDAVLGRLGDPLSIAAAARHGVREPTMPTDGPFLLGDQVVRATVVVLIPLGQVLSTLMYPLVLSLAGLLLLWWSPLWPTRIKLFGTLAVFGALPIFGVASAVFASQEASCTQSSFDARPQCTTDDDPWWVATLPWVPLGVLIAVSVLTMVGLWRTAKRRRPVPV